MSKGDFINGPETPEKHKAPAYGDKPEEGVKTNLYLFIALGCFIVGAILFGLSFAIKGAGTYMLFGSMITELAAVTFLNVQKRHGYTVWCKVLRIASYAVMLAAILLVIMGMAIVNK